MPFGFVSAWNKRRRSKSQDHSDPCINFSFLLFSFLYVVTCAECIVLKPQFVTNYTLALFSGIYKPAEFWQLEDHIPQPTKRRHRSCVFTLKEMDEATCSFSDDNLLGKGGFGRVYRGNLKSGEVIITF